METMRLREAGVDYYCHVISVVWTSARARWRQRKRQLRVVVWSAEKGSKTESPWESVIRRGGLVRDAIAEARGGARKHRDAWTVTSKIKGRTAQ
jgi:hypothetical protein